jgi:hypothetical protein
MTQIVLFFLAVPVNDALTHGYITALKWILPFGLSIICLRFTFKPVNIFLSAFIILSLVTGLVDVMQTPSMDMQNAKPSISLKKTPNIYLFWQESYHDFETMEDRFGIDTSDLRHYLDKNNFVVYNNVFSNGFYTLLSMAQTFSMQHNGISKGNFDVTQQMRNIIGGGDGNEVYRILKENSYYTQCIVLELTDYYFKKREKYLDETDLHLNTFFGSLLPLINLNPITESLVRSNALLANGIKNKFYDRQKDFNGNLPRMVNGAVEEALARGKPLFLGFKAGAVHSPIANYSWKKQKNEWVASGTYQEKVKAGNILLMQIVDDITAKDPHSIIILIGDHGAGVFRGIWDDFKKPGDIKELDAVLKADGESLESMAHDMFGVLLAIRTPEGAKDISGGLPISHVNLFRHIFAWCNDDPMLLASRVPQISKVADWELVKDGEITKP